MTTYGFFIRMLQPAVPQHTSRPKRSALKQILYAVGIALESLAAPDPTRLRVLDPTALAGGNVERVATALGLDLVYLELAPNPWATLTARALRT